MTISFFPYHFYFYNELTDIDNIFAWPLCMQNENIEHCRIIKYDLL